MIRPADNATLVPAIAHALRRQIWLGQHPPGAHLNQRELAARLRVSVIPLREAIRMLEAEGLIRILPHRGAEVTPVTVAEVEEWRLEALGLVATLLPMALPGLTDETLARIRELTPLVEGAYGQVDQHLEYWMLILQPLHLPRFKSLVEQALWRYGRYRQCRAWAALAGNRDLRPDRADLLEVLQARDGARAVQIFQDFLTVRVRVLQRGLLDPASGRFDRDKLRKSG